MRVLVAMSGGVDSSVAAALLAAAGHEVVGATMKLWGGPSDSGCCSLADVSDARRVADQLGLAHHVFNFSEDFESAVVSPYAAAHAAGRTPNPCVECNRHLKFDRLLARARRLGFDAVATGHHARLARRSDGRTALLRGRDRAKDQSYVLAVLGGETLASLLLPVGELDKAEVRRRARDLGLRTADKPDSQDVCFIASRAGGGSGRGAFLAGRIGLQPGRVLDARSGELLGEVPALELVTVGQRRGLPTASGRARRFVVAVDPASRTVLAGESADLEVEELALSALSWVHDPLPPGSEVEVQCSAHGSPRPALLTAEGVRLRTPARRVAPGQLVAIFRGDEVLGSGVAEAAPLARARP